MNPWTAWHRPNRGRVWHKLGEAATEADAWSLALAADCGSGGLRVVSPGKPEPRPQGIRSPTLEPRGEIQWDSESRPPR